MLSQLDANGKEHPIAYGGRALRNEELRWHITDKEGLALVEAVRQFRPYLASMPFTVYTDNVSVKWLQQIKNCQGRLGRWALLLQGYNMEIIQKSSRNNANADGLSRRSYPPVPEEEVEEPEVCTVGYEVTFCYANDPSDIKVHSVEAQPAKKSSDKERNCPNLQRLQQNCPDFKAICKYKTTSEVPDDEKQAKTLVAEASQFEIQNGLLYHFYTPRSRGLPRGRKVGKTVGCTKDHAWWHTEVIPWFFGWWWAPGSWKDFCGNKTQILLAKNVWPDWKVCAVMWALSAGQKASACETTTTSATTRGRPFR